ncbi:hypothetical protein [Myxococcus sp. RHSTA-1-4]|uniref:hypothetical protein n=1 Tax=Myxococcus sp. RHSTA-1-4 TaxID=2874601 RepID=UPI001CBE33BD|nr:hypothetical protein [Myxococcus sp. RHSTA-1-4]MBZ4421774.1 hypothetical protein [Myxococcus sp. RHSTA-1-4]
MPKDTLALGRELVRNLELDARGTMLERWLAHHLAELMVEAEKATGSAKADAVARAADIILRLWAKRRDMPATADPLGGYREAIAVLSRLMPDHNPWESYARQGDEEQVLHALFDCMARVVVCGLLRTALRPREVGAAEKEALEPEELALREQLDWWEKVIFGPEDNQAVPSTNAGEEGEPRAAAALGQTGGQSSDPSDEHGGSEEEASDGAYDSDEVEDANGNRAALRLRAHEAATKHLERFQQELATLIQRWRATSRQT